MTSMIDLPSPFASLEEWESFLAEMKRIKSPDDDVRAAIIEAEARVGELKGVAN